MPPPPTLAKLHIQPIALIPDLAIPEFAHIPDPENFSPAQQKQLTACFVHSPVIRIYLIYCIPDSKSQSQPNQSGIRA